jgi:hypothetical protein
VTNLRTLHFGTKGANPVWGHSLSPKSIAQSTQQVRIHSAFQKFTARSDVFEFADFRILFSFALREIAYSSLQCSMEGASQVCGKNAHNQSFQRTAFGRR